MKRMDYADTAPKALNILFQQEKYLHQQFAHHSVLNPVIWELVKIRVSQINQCAFCIDMHSKDALKERNPSESGDWTLGKICRFILKPNKPRYSGQKPLQWKKPFLINSI